MAYPESKRLGTLIAHPAGCTISNVVLPGANDGISIPAAIEVVRVKTVGSTAFADSAKRMAIVGKFD